MKRRSFLTGLLASTAITPAAPHWRGWMDDPSWLTDLNDIANDMPVRPLRNLSGGLNDICNGVQHVWHWGDSVTDAASGEHWTRMGDGPWCSVWDFL